MRFLRRGAMAWAWLLMGPALGAAPGSRQATYDAAQAAYDKSDWNAAITGFASLLPREHGRPLQPSEAVIAGLLSSALLNVGRFGEARAAADRAIAALPATDSANLIDATMTEASAARFDFDYTEALTGYARVYALAERTGDKTAMVNARIGEAYAAVTVDPVSVGHDLDAVFADKALLATVDKKVLPTLEDLRARAAINAGDAETARIWIKRAIDHAGGLTTHVDMSQVAARNDAAIIASLRKDDEDARQYLLYTGAGHLKDMKWIGRFEGELPVCSDYADIRPDDSVVLQFAIADDGHVESAAPVYASRPGTLGATFARAVSHWRWNPDLIKSVDPFWRATLVLQLRCQSRPKPDGPDAPVVAAYVDWLKAHAVDASADDFGSFVGADDPRLLQDGIPAIPALFGGLRYDSKTRAATEARLRGLLDANGAPASAYALLIKSDASAHVIPAGGVRAGSHARAAVLASLVPPFRSRYPDDLATAWLDLEWALALEDGGDFSAAQPLLQSVLATPPSVLTSDAPIRRVATLHAALVAGRLGDKAAAQTYLARSGLSADQCSLFDTHPVPSSVGIASSQFPTDALRWHFEGFVEEAFDIASDGRVANVRTIVAYPPFVFAPGTEQAVRGFRYVPPTIEGKSVGCVGQTQSVNYQIPGA